MLNSGLQKIVSLLMTAHASESFGIASGGSGLVSLILGGISSPKFFNCPS
jgi:hypothetical protein